MTKIFKAVAKLFISAVFIFSVLEPVHAQALESVGDDTIVRLNLAVNDRTAFLQCKINDPVVIDDLTLGLVSVTVNQGQFDEKKAYYEACPGVQEAYGDIMAQQALIPLDPNYASNQFNLKNIGLETVWNTTKGSANVVVAVIDTGVDPATTLSDFAAGTILKGVSILTDENTYVQSTKADTYVGQYSYDGGSHGTAVAMVIAAAMNSKTITGVAPGVKILPVKVFRDEKSVNENVNAFANDIAKGIVWAVEHGADIINLSLGSSESDGAVYNAIRYAYSKNVLVVAASGNDSDHNGSSTGYYTDAPISYPAAYSEVISVGSINKSNALSNFSNYSENSLEIVAYGESIWLPWSSESKYKALSGTSFSSPTVAGVLALLLSAYPTLTQFEARGLLLSSAKDLTAYGVGYDEKTGYGLVNAQEAFRLAALISPGRDNNDTYATAKRINFDEPYAATLSNIGDRDLYCITTYKTENLQFSIDSETDLPLRVEMFVYNVEDNALDMFNYKAGTSTSTLYNINPGTYCGAVYQFDGLAKAQPINYTASFHSDLLVSVPTITAVNLQGPIYDGETSYGNVSLTIESSYQHTISVTKDGVPFDYPGSLNFNQEGSYIVTVDDVLHDPVTFSFSIMTGLSTTLVGDRYYSDNVFVYFTADSATIDGLPLTYGKYLTEESEYHLVFTIGDRVYPITINIDKTAPIVEGYEDYALFESKPITFNEGTATLDGLPFTSGSVITEEGTHKLVITDKARNVTTRYPSIIDSIRTPNVTAITTPTRFDFTVSNCAPATFYRLSSVDPLTSEVTFISEFTGFTKTLSDLPEFNQEYTYQFEACITLNGVTLCSSPKIVSFKTTMASVKFTSTTLGASNFKLSWSQTDHATSYEIYADGVLRGTTTELTYTLNLPDPVYPYDTWNVYVLAVTQVNGQRVVSQQLDSDVKTLEAQLPKVSNIALTKQADESYKLTFDAVPGASSYRVIASQNNYWTEIYNAEITSTSVIFPTVTGASPLAVKIITQKKLSSGYTMDSVVATASIMTDPAKPVLSGTVTGPDSFQLTWTTDNYSSGYIVYERNPLTMEYVALNAGTSSNTMTITGKKIGEISTYMVKAFLTNKGVTTYSSPSNNFSISPLPAALTGVKVALIGADRLTLAYDAQPGISGIEVWTSTTATGAFTLKTSLAANAVQTVTGLAFNTTAYLRVRPYVQTESARYYGPYSAVISAKTALEPIQGYKVASKSYNSNALSWTTVSLATGYEVYFSVGTSTTYSLLATVTTSSYTHINLLTNTQYNYKVRPYRLVGTTKIYGAFTAISSSKPVPAIPVLTAGSTGTDSIKATWPAVAGATGYEVTYSLDEAFGTVTTVNVTAVSFALSGLATNVPVYLKVRAYRLVGTVKVFGGSSDPVSIKPVPNTPIMTGAVLDYQSIKLSWNAILNAGGYELYKLNNDTKAYDLVQDSLDLTYTENGLISGVAQSYKLKAYVLVNEVRIYSNVTPVLSLTPIPSLITGLKVSLPKYIELSLSWNAVNGATGYEITRSTSATGTYAMVANVENALTFVNSGLAFNATYYYKVRAYRTVDGVKVYGNATAYVSGKTTLETVLNPTAAYTAYNANKLTWSAVNGATGYEIYRSTGTSTYYAYLTATTATSYTNTSLYTNTKYNYKIRAYRLVGTVKVYGAFSSIVSATPLPWAPTVTVASVNNTTLKVSWPVVAGANGYEVSYSTSETGIYTKLALLTTTSASITKLLTNTTYYVKVRAYRIVNYVKIYGASSVLVSGKPIPATPVVTAVSGGVGAAKLSWLAITGASGYEVYLKTPESLDYFLASDTTALTVTLTRLQTGALHSVKVLAYQMINGNKVYSLESAVKTVTPIPSTVTGFKLAMPSITSLKLAWTSVDGATGYELFKSTTATGTFVSIGVVGQVNEFTVTGLTFNSTTYYKIRALYQGDNGTVYGLSTAALAAKTVPSTVQLSVTNPSYNSNALSWPAIEGATGYEIVVSTGTSTYYTLLKSLTTTSYTHATLSFNTQYNYKVRAYRLVGTVKYYGAYSTLTSVKTAVSAPTAIVNSTHDSISLTWNAVIGASGYEVSIATSLTGPYTVTTQTAVSKAFSGLTTGTTYYVKLRSYRLISTTKIYGPYAQTIIVTPSLAVPALSLNGLTDTTVTLNWAVVAGATDYEVRIKSDAVDADWIVESVSEQTVTFSDLDPLAHYVAEIRAVKKVGEVSYTSEYSVDLAFSYADTY